MNKWISLQNRSSHRCREKQKQKLMVTQGERGGSDKLGDWDWHVNILYIKQITNKDLLYRVGHDWSDLAAAEVQLKALYSTLCMHMLK